MTLQQVLIALHIDATHVTIDDLLCMVICIENLHLTAAGKHLRYQIIG